MINVTYSRKVMPDAIAGCPIHYQPATLSATVTETIDGVEYSTTVERCVKGSVSGVEQTKALQGLVNDCRSHNNEKAKKKGKPDELPVNQGVNNQLP